MLFIQLEIHGQNLALEGRTLNPQSSARMLKTVIRYSKNSILKVFQNWSVVNA